MVARFLRLSNGKLQLAGAKFFASVSNAGQPAGSLTLLDHSTFAVVQRTAGQTTGTVCFNFRYTNPAPAGVQVKVVSGATTIVDWSDLTNLTINQPAATGYGWLVVPQGANYQTLMRDKYAPGTVLTGTANWGVGIVVLVTGQADNTIIWASDAQSSETTSYLTNPGLVSLYTDAGWYPQDSTAFGGGHAATAYNTLHGQNTGMAEAFARQIRNKLGGIGIPVGIVYRAVSTATAFSTIYAGAQGTFGSQTAGDPFSWWTSQGTGSSSSNVAGMCSTVFQNQPGGQFGDLEMVFFSQGGTDGTTSGASAWEGALENWYTNVLIPALSSATGGARNAKTLGFGVEIIKSAQASSQPYLDQIRQGDLTFVANHLAQGHKVASFCTLTDLPYSGTAITGSSATYGKVGARLTQTAFNFLGVAAFSGAGPELSTAVKLNATAIRINVLHEGGTALTNAAGQGVGGDVSGFYFSTDNFATGNGPGSGNYLTPSSVTISGAASIDATFSTNLPASSIYIKYLGGGSNVSTEYDTTNHWAAGPAPDISNCVYDNTILPNNPNFGGVSGTNVYILGDSGTTSTLGLPLQPSVSVVIGAASISSVSLAPSTTDTTQPANTLIGTLTFVMSDGSHPTGTFTLNSNANIKLVNNTSIETAVNNVPVGTYPIGGTLTVPGATNSPFTWSATVTVTGGPQPISDIVFHNGSPAGVNYNANTYAGYGPVYIGTFEAVGGVGPFTFTTGTANPQLFSPGGYYGVQSSSNGPIVAAYGFTAAMAGTNQPCTVIVTGGDGATFTKTFQIPVVSTPVMFSADNRWFYNQSQALWLGFDILGGNFQPGLVNPSVQSWTLSNDSSGGHLTIDPTYKTVTTLNYYVLPAGTYTYTLTCKIVATNETHSENFTLTILNGTAPTFVGYHSTAPANTATPPGTVIGRLTSTDGDNSFGFTQPAGPNFNNYLTISQYGYISITQFIPSAGPQTANVIVQDGSLSFSGSFTVSIGQGNLLPASNMSITVANNLTNYMGGTPTIMTPTVTGITGTPVWSFSGPGTARTSGGGVYPGRYQIDSSTGIVTSPYPLTAFPTDLVDQNGVLMDFRDKLTLTVTDGTNTCVSNPTAVTVAAKAGPNVEVGPGQTYAHLADAFAAAKNSPDAFAGCTFNVHGTSDATYYVNDPVATNLSQYIPFTVKAVVGSPPVYITASVGGALTDGKGMFTQLHHDVTFIGLTIGLVTAYTSSGRPNLAAFCKEASCSSGMTRIDQCYIFNCDDGMSRGCPNASAFITNSIVSRCGIGDIGYDHNFYFIDADTTYLYNVKSTMATVGHLFKQRCPLTYIIKCVIADLAMGNSSYQIDMAEGGLFHIYNSVIHKGPNTQQYAGALHFGDRGDVVTRVQDYMVATCQGNTWLCESPIPGSYNIGSGSVGSTTSCFFTRSLSGAVSGLPAAINSTNDKFYGWPNGLSYILPDPDTGQNGTITITNPTMLTSRPLIDMSWPGSTYPDPRPTYPDNYYFLMWGNQTSPQFTLPAGVYELSCPANAAPGTTVGTIGWRNGPSGPQYLPQFSITSTGTSASRFSLNSSTGVLTTTSVARTAGTVDIFTVTETTSNTPWNFYVVNT